MSPYIAEFIGTAMLVLLGNGAVANVLLARTKGKGADLIVIVMGWAMAVFIAVFMTASFSGAHLNPVVTISLALAGKFAWSKVAGYVDGADARRHGGRGPRVDRLSPALRQGNATPTSSSACSARRPPFAARRITS